MKRFLTQLVTSTEAKLLSDACDSSEVTPGQTDQEFIAAWAKDAAPKLRPLLTNGFTSTLEQMRNNRCPGLLVLDGLPKVADPRTLIALIGNLLGTMIKYPNEGEYIIPITEKKTEPGERPSFQNAREFYHHTDLSYIDNPPDFLLMHAVVNNEGEGGISLFADIEEAASELSPLVIAELQKKQFLFPSPPHFKGGGTILHSILTQPQDSDVWQLRFRRDNLRAETRSGIEAIVELVQAINDTEYEVMLSTDRLVIVDNQSFLHGRTAFAGGSHSQKLPRHLNRIYVGRKEYGTSN